MAFKSVLLGVKTPVPPVHMPPVAIVIVPLRVTSALLAHEFKSTPAFTVGDAVKVTVIASDSALHAPLPVVVSVRVNVPEAISTALGEYVAFKLFASGLKVPTPPLH